VGQTRGDKVRSSKRLDQGIHKPGIKDKSVICPVQGLRDKGKGKGGVVQRR